MTSAERPEQQEDGVRILPPERGADAARPVRGGFWRYTRGAAPAMSESERARGASSPSHRFPTTRWSVVRSAGRTASPESRAALEILCATYWSPVQAFVRRSGHDADEASELTQAFFARVIEKGDLGNARDTLGRFRTFLLTAVRHFLSNQADHDRAAKRGGGRPHLPLDSPAADDHLRVPEPASDETPETVYEHHWAMTVLEVAMARLKHDCEVGGEASLFEALYPFLAGDESASYEEVAHALQKSEGAVRVAVHRLRRRFGTCLRETAADTVDTASDVDAELAYLLEVVARRPRASSLGGS